MPARESGAPPEIRIDFTDRDVTSIETDALVLAVSPGVDTDEPWQGPLADVDAALDGSFRQTLRDSNFNGKVGKTLVIPTLGRLAARRVIVTGLPQSGVTPEDIRRAYGAAASAARNSGAKEAACAPPLGELDEVARYRAAVEGFLLALYDFKRYKSDQGSDDKRFTRWTFVASESDTARRGVDIGYSVASGIYLARDLVNEPGNSLYPETFAAIAREIATNNELEYQEYDEQQLAEMGATCITTVGQGSTHPPRMMHVTYTPRTGPKGTIAFVGKGITFDTGGMNLKPTGGIEQMKSDMAGAAAVLGAMRAIAALELPFTVYGIIAAAENMPSGTAYRPGDVLTAMNGKTIEIISTDAEGRLVLADALVYAARNGADELIDLATLTGAKIVALGNQSVAVFSNDDDFAKRVVAAGSEAGDLFWHMPLWQDLKKQIDSQIADMKNSGGRPGGAITAALLLAEFTEGLPWVHLDIAGAALADSARDYTPKGATGVGVRALVEYLEAKAGESR